MRNIIQLAVILALLILTFVTIVGESRFVPRPEKVHFGSITFPRRWGQWCSDDNDCGLGYCAAYMCQCYRGYITWYFMETCAYEQRSKLTAFLVSFFVGILGIDWFLFIKRKWWIYCSWYFKINYFVWMSCWMAVGLCYWSEKIAEIYCCWQCN